ncbi:MAG: diacylglycerol kinase family lipid kinase [Coriobacteriales bacterium]|jgi:YegS/Rv2252/BmrU family lipid kinase|nr:diacylglycerol kinase family lipid kinase [Coriobacteriales bacterium]
MTADQAPRPIGTFRRVAVIVNPRANAGAASRVFPLMRERLAQILAGAELSCLVTQDAAHATRLGAFVPADLLVMVSGDGTVHNVAQGLMRRPRAERPALCMLPVGSGNDYARTLGMPLEAAAALDGLASAVCVPTDVGCCTVLVPPPDLVRRKLPPEQVYFLETMSIGVDAAVALNTMELRASTRSRGRSLYARAAVSAIVKELRPYHAEYTIDGTPHSDDLLIFAVQNGPTYGSGFKVAPRARITDGVLNVCTGRNMGALRALRCLLRIKSGTHEQHPRFSTYECRELTVSLDRLLPIQCDGERVSGSSFAVSVIPGALDVLVPEGSPVLDGLRSGS